MPLKDPELQKKKQEYYQQHKDYRQRPEVKQQTKERNRKRYLSHKEQIKKQRSEHYFLHKEEIRKKVKKQNQRPKVKAHRLSHQKEYRQQNLTKLRLNDKEYHQRPEVKEQTRKHLQEPKVKQHYRTKNKKWRKKNPERYRELMARHNEKRSKWGHYPLNEYFDGADEHHIDFECVVWIPHELHESIRHCVWTGRNMELINDKAFEWLGFN